MLLWFVSLVLTICYNFPDTELADLEVGPDGVVWLLPAFGSSVVRLFPDSTTDTFETGISGLPVGLALSTSGHWAASFRNPDRVVIFDSGDVVLGEISVKASGDILFAGMDMWMVEPLTGKVVSSDGVTVGEDCCGPDSRLCALYTGDALVSGSAGVFLLQSGTLPVKTAARGSACLTSGGILLLDGGVLCFSEGDTLFSDLPFTRISASPDGETVVLWGNAPPMVME